jgi:predicted oxidoreductase (fatty acid repression mutant protein)
LVETYNQDKNSISDKAKAMVAETQTSLNQRRSGSSDIVALENTTQKKYWIIEEDNDYYLVPHAKIKIDEYNKTTLESLFDCTNFTSEYSDFQLVKPAKVSQTDSETWQLEKKGKLDFY